MLFELHRNHISSHCSRWDWHNHVRRRPGARKRRPLLPCSVLLLHLLQQERPLFPGRGSDLSDWPPKSGLTEREIEKARELKRQKELEEEKQKEIDKKKQQETLKIDKKELEKLKDEISKKASKELEETKVIDKSKQETLKIDKKELEKIKDEISKKEEKKEESKDKSLFDELEKEKKKEKKPSFFSRLFARKEKKKVDKQKQKIEKEKESLEQALSEREFNKVPEAKKGPLRTSAYIKDRKKAYRREALKFTLVFVVIDVMIYFMTNYINYLHLFDIIWVNIVVSLVLLILVIFFFTYLVERIYGEKAYKRMINKKKNVSKN